MGWDAYAVDRRGEWVATYDGRQLVIRDKRVVEAFQDAARWVREATGSVDGLLPYGGLNVSTCGEMLEQAGIRAWGEDLSPEDVQSLKPDWNAVKYNPSQRWAFESAKAFWETCRRLGLGIQFSY